MSPGELAYAEARRRIQKAEETGAVVLSLGGLWWLDRLPRELERLTSLQQLDLSECSQLSDFSLLANLTSLQELHLSGCSQLSDFSPLANLTSLQGLNLSGCSQLSDLSPLANLTSLQGLNLYECRRLSDLLPLANLTSLQHLNLSWWRMLSDASPLAKLTSLLKLKFNVSWWRQLGGDLSPLANLTSLQHLNLSRWRQLSDLSPLGDLTSLQQLSWWRQLSDLSPLAYLTLLQELSLSGWRLLSDLSPLANLTSLQQLDLSECSQLSDLSPLANLISLQKLNLNHCFGVRQFGPLKSLLHTLQEISLFGCKFDDLPLEVCGIGEGENVVDEVRAHYADLEYGVGRDAALKVFFLGNGGVGKTQLCRRLRRLKYDPKIPTTHGVQLGEMTVRLDGIQEPVRLNLWDFGGQDIYHGSHALFLHGHAIFLILWTPTLEHQTTYQEGALSFRHRPLAYWLDYLRAFAGTDASMLIVQSQCDTRDKRILHPPAPVDDFPFHRYTEVSARTGLNLGILKENIKEAVRDCFDRIPPPPIGLGRLRVRDRLRQMLEEDQERESAKRQHRLLERAEFDRLCAETGMVSDSDALLDFLHHNGIVFYQPGLFGGRILLDQNWALEAIYALFDRKKILPLLRGYGRFSRADLEAIIWSGYSPEEQKVFLGMMESCGICFRVRELPHDPTESVEKGEAEWEYIAPELLPKWSDAQELLFGRLRDDPPDAEATARYPFLHEGILRGYLSKLGEHAKDAAIYWKYGCWFYEQTTRSQVLIESQWEDAESGSGAGTIRLRAWGENAESLIDLVLDALRKLPVGQAPKIEQTKRFRVHARSSSSASVVPRLVLDSPSGDAVSLSHGAADKAGNADPDKLQITVRPELPLKGTAEIFVSYSWGDNTSEDALKRGEVVDRLCETFDKDGWNILRDKTNMRPGDLISGFMKRIGLADHVIVVLSDKYLRSPYCMTELHSIYQRSVDEKVDFLRRIIPLVLADARISAWRDRANYAKHWKTEYEEMKHELSNLGTADFRLYKEMQKWYLDVGEILAHVSDVLSPHGFDDIVKDEFAALRQMLQRARSELRA
jgi:internalin A